MYNQETMMAQLMSTMDQINDEIQEVNRFAAEEEIPVATVRYPDGRWVMAELSLAKAQVLHAMVLMEEQFSREVMRQKNKNAFEKEMSGLLPGHYVYNGRGVHRIGDFQQDDHEWLQTAAERNRNHIYFYYG